MAWASCSIETIVKTWHSAIWDQQTIPPFCWPLIRLTSSVHPNASLWMIALDNCGSTGNSAIRLPNLVNSPLWFNAPSAYRFSNDLINVSAGGGSRKSKLSKSLIPRDFNMRTTLPRLVLWISGIVSAKSSLLYAYLVYSRNAFPGPTRPARPDRWEEEAREI
jgi:hypothetical protein